MKIERTKKWIDCRIEETVIGDKTLRDGWVVKVYKKPKRNW